MLRRLLPRGGPSPPPAESVPAVAELVGLGLAPLPDRAAVGRLLEAEDGAAGVGRSLGALGEDPARRRREGVLAWARLLEQPGEEPAGPPPDELVVPAVAALRDIPLRDALIGWLAPGVVPRSRLEPVVLALLERRLPRRAGLGTWRPGGVDPDERPAVLERLLAVCRRVPDERPTEAAAVCTTAAHLAWQAGDGAVARSALERALRVEPGYRLAQLLARLIALGLRPDQLLDRAG
ncbi:DUF4192 family protein [Phycicoccus endophyticus]|uniref:DUF4192 family protein n=1 Tax=Phycicoccus endophyticus TaxID=1690220 RepID=A0A7G9R559_9MICO|nr:DUF4192 family protein [Phycicoccus endophyticus]